VPLLVGGGWVRSTPTFPVTPSHSVPLVGGRSPFSTPAFERLSHRYSFSLRTRCYPCSFSLLTTFTLRLRFAFVPQCCTFAVTPCFFAANFTSNSLFAFVSRCHVIVHVFSQIHRTSHTVCSFRCYVSFTFTLLFAIPVYVCVLLLILLRVVRWFAFRLRTFCGCYLGALRYFVLFVLRFYAPRYVVSVLPRCSVRYIDLMPFTFTLCSRCFPTAFCFRCYIAAVCTRLRALALLRLPKGRLRCTFRFVTRRLRSFYALALYYCSFAFSLWVLFCSVL